MVKMYMKKVRKNNSSWSSKEVEALFQSKFIHHLPNSEIATLLNKSFESVKSKIQRDRKIFLCKLKAWSKEHETATTATAPLFKKTVPESPIDEDEIVKDYAADLEEAVEKAKYDLAVKNDYRIYNDLLRKQASIEIISDKFSDAVQALPPVNIKSMAEYKVPKLVGNKSEDAVLLIGDVHVGDFVTAEESFGLGNFNIEVFKARMRRLRDKVCEVTGLHRQLYNVDKLHVMCLGDLVQGMNAAGQWSPVYIEQDVLTQVFECMEEFNSFLAVASNFFKEVNFYGVFGNHGKCLSKETKALTPDGYKHYTELKVGDLIGTINTSNHRFEFQPIKQIHVFYEEEIYVHERKSLLMEVTSDHDILVKTRKGGNLIKHKYKDLPKFNRIPISTKSQKQEYSISDEELFLLGLIMADGRYLPNSNTIKIYQSKMKNVNIIRNLLRNMEINFSESSRQRKTDNILGVKIKSQLKECSFTLKSSALIKNIRRLLPVKESIQPWMYDLSDRQVSVLLDGIVFGDGTIRKAVTNVKGRNRSGGRDAVWGKKEFLEQLVGLLISHNIPCSLNEHKRKIAKTNNYYIQLRQSEKFYINKNNINKKEYNDYVWCVTTENGTIAVMSKNGDPFFTGNCAPKGVEKHFVNWDYVMYKFIEKSMINYKNINFNLNKSWMQMATVQNKKFLLIHGDDIKSWGGLPFYGLQRAEGRYRSLLEQFKTPNEAYAICKPYWDKCQKNPDDAGAALELIQNIMLYSKSFDYLVAGHYHIPATIPTGAGGKIILNGAFVGGDMYSLKNLQSAFPPVQKFFGVNKKGVTWQYDLELERE